MVEWYDRPHFHPKWFWRPRTLRDSMELTRKAFLCDKSYTRGWGEASVECSVECLQQRKGAWVRVSSSHEKPRSGSGDVEVGESLALAHQWEAVPLTVRWTVWPIGSLDKYSPHHARDPSSVPEVPTVGGENRLVHVILWPAHVLWDIYAPIHTKK